MNNWSIFLNSENLIIYQKFAGEIRLGPEYFELKTDPIIIDFNNKIFGDQFYRTSNGVFLQEWNSIKNANTNLIYIDFTNQNFIRLHKNIESVFWNIIEDENYYKLNINSNFIEFSINKELINKNCR